MAKTEASTEPKPAIKKARLQPNRLRLIFGTKRADIHDRIIRDAQEDDRQPGDYLVRWLDKHYADASGSK